MKISQRNNLSNLNRKIEEQILGTWLRLGPQGIFTIEFKEGGLVETDMGNDGDIDVFEVFGDTISFKDIKGETCPDAGKYRVLLRNEYVAFDILEDDCGGRIKITNDYWTRPDYHEKCAEFWAKH